MALLGLNVPTDIRWERICVSTDMLDARACDPHLPLKWRSSIAVFKYVPEADYQIYEGRRITYLKVTVTLTGHQIGGEEIEGTIDWNGIHSQLVEHIDALLDEYLPCSGAVIQVTVTPKTAGSVADLEDYPYFIDFQPKKRELYESATDTRERMSRSLETLNVRKAAGSTEGVEVLDIDQGFSVGAQASYMGTGGGFNYSHQGQWGTRNLTNREGSLVTTSDSSRERREGYSHSTQLSQVYNQLDSYHLGTNRVVFLLSPRPHTVADSNGFVSGPRSLDGIQEFFLVVSQPKEQEDFCIAVRLDTGHLTDTDEFEHDRSRSDTVSCQAAAIPPPSQDPLAEGGERVADQTLPIVLGPTRLGDSVYACYRRHIVRSETYRPPDGYRIDTSRGGGFIDVDRTERNGISSVTVAPGGDALTIRCEASSHACYFSHNTFPALGAPSELDKWSGFVNREVLVYLVSRERTIHSGSHRNFLVTTRGLCCCPEAEGAGLEEEKVLAWSAVGTYSSAMPKVGSESLQQPAAATPCHGAMTLADANALTESLRVQLRDISVAASRKPGRAQSVVESDFFVKRLAARVRADESLRASLDKQPAEPAAPNAASAVARLLHKDASSVTAAEVLSIDAELLAKSSETSKAVINREKLQLLGVKQTAAPPPQRRRASGSGTPPTKG